MIQFIAVIGNEKIRSNLEKIYTMYQKDLWFIARDILKDDHEAEDIVHSAFIKFADHIDENTDVKCNKTRGLIVIIVRRLAINLYNQRKRRAAINIDELENILEDGEDPMISVIRLNESEMIAKKLAEMKPEYADLLTLKYYYGYSNKEIADICNLEESNVRVKTHRARRTLYSLIGGEQIE